MSDALHGVRVLAPDLPVPLPSASYLGYTGGARIARALPDSVGRSLAHALGGGAVHLLPARRAQVERNLRRIHGAMPEPELRRRVRETFRNYGRFWYEFLSLTGDTVDGLLDRVDVTGWEHIEKVVADGRGAIGVVPHLGGYDILGAWMSARGVPLTVVVETVEPPELFDWFLDARTSFGMDVVPLGPDAGAAMARALADGRITALMSDRDLTGDGVEVEFFGETTTLPGGPALLAFRSGAPIIPAAAFLDEGDRFRLILEEPIPVERQGRLREDIARVTQEIAWRFENFVRQAPEQWFVLQPNWPSDSDTTGGRAP